MSKLFHAFEIYAENIIQMGAYTSKQEADNEFAFWKRIIRDENIDTYLLGTVYADNWEDALNKLRAGDWNWTQFN